MFVSLLAVAGMIWFLVSGDRATSRSDMKLLPPVSTEVGDGLLLFCAASNRAAMESVRERYEAETGRKLEIQYGASQTLLSQIELTGVGDIFLPADDSFIRMAQEKSLVAETVPLATMRCGIAVPRGNPKGIDDLTDLFSPDLRLVQANPEAAAVGRLTKEVTTSLGLWDQLNSVTDAYRTTVTDVANDIVIGAADAGIVYDAVLSTFPDLEFISVPQLKEAVSTLVVGVLAGSQQPTEALHFVRYLSAEDRGLENYRQHGFLTLPGDVWSETPELTLFAGAMLRPAIEDTLIRFEQREGVRISRSYNGCGILVAQMKSGQQPDAYFACDTEFLQQVENLFQSAVVVSRNELAILVQKGNPHNIANLSDLTKPGLRVGIGHEKQCAMGWVTQKTLEQSGLRTRIMENVTVQTPTGDMLVNQLRTGSLDAVVAYLSNAAGAGEFIDAVRIEGLTCSVATQPWAVARNSRYPRLTERLFRDICSADSQAIFTAEGFHWQLQESGSENP
jgi:molybdenum ABC transporter molybdate-binding protein